MLMVRRHRSEPKVLTQSLQWSDEASALRFERALYRMLWEHMPQGRGLV